ncbi:MAG: homoserine dehydrogenase [Acidobacteria bacterium]|nr:homoserine dehydrogenase [Acidobacteriota bacterium]
MYLDLLLVGFGHVARRFVKLLDERASVLHDRHDVRCRIVGVTTARHGAAFDPNGLSTAVLLDRYASGSSIDGTDRDRAGRDYSWLLSEARHHTATACAEGRVVLIETTPLDVTNGGFPAIDHVREALLAGAHVITANKAPVAFGYRDLAARAAAAGRRFFFEGAVMDGIPIFNLVRETLPACEILRFRGVVNATTNFILTAMERGRTYHDALTEMQRAGIAEADASHDEDGWDAAAKTAALINVLMDGDATPLTVAREGIRAITPDRVHDARARGRRIRLVASAQREGGLLLGRVAPEELHPGDPLAQLDGLQNGLLLETDVLGTVGILQLDGGLTQTAYALLSDLITIAKQGTRDRNRGHSLAPSP